MKNTLTGLALVIMASTAQAEIDYDYTNPEHKADNTCVGVLSYFRDLLYSDVYVQDGIVFLKKVASTPEVKQYRVKATELQNSLILKYAPSRQFITHYQVRADLTKQRTLEQGPEYLADQLTACGFEL